MPLESQTSSQKFSVVSPLQKDGTKFDTAPYAKLFENTNIKFSVRSGSLKLGVKYARSKFGRITETLMIIPQGTPVDEVRALVSKVARRGVTKPFSGRHLSKPTLKASNAGVSKAERFRSVIATIRGIDQEKATAVTAREQIVVTKAFTRAFENLSLSADEAGSIIGVQGQVVLKFKDEVEYLEARGKPFELALLFIRLFKQLDAMFGGDLKNAIHWLRNFNTAIGEIPATRISSIAGLCDVVAYLEGRHGAV